jgi:hypothetical protein
MEAAFSIYCYIFNIPQIQVSNLFPLLFLKNCGIMVSFGEIKSYPHIKPVRDRRKPKSISSLGFILIFVLIRQQNCNKINDWRKAITTVDHHRPFKLRTDTKSSNVCF